MQSYAITDRHLLPGAHEQGRLTSDEYDGLVHLADAWTAGGVDYIQIREKDVPPRELAELARAMKAAICGRGARLLINAGSPIALEGILDVVRTARADGVHLSGRWVIEQVSAACVIGIVSVACHSVGEVSVAKAAGADVALLSSIFPTPSHPGEQALGLERLAAACRAAESGVRTGCRSGPMAVFALGGVNPENAAACITAGAAGVAGIRMFLQGRWADVMAHSPSAPR